MKQSQKKLWMYWSQGADDPNMPDLNKRCLSLSSGY